MSLTFGELHARWPDCPGSLLAVAFDSLSGREQGECWAELADRRDRWIDAELVLERELYMGPTPATSRRSDRPPLHRLGRAPSSLSSADPLRQIPPVEYVEALAGEAVPANGWMRCPFPGHDDATPSFKVSATTCGVSAASAAGASTDSPRHSMGSSREDRALPSCAP